MLAKVVDFFSLLVFSTNVVVSDVPNLPVYVYDDASYPYGIIYKDLDSMSVLNSSLFDKPVYFLWDLNTFLQRWDLYISAEFSSVSIKIFYYEFKDCNVSSSAASMPSSTSFLEIPLSIFKELSNNLRLSYRFENSILSLGDYDGYSISILSLLDYYQQRNMVVESRFIYSFLSSFIEYNCHTGFTINVRTNPVSVYLVPKWNNLSGINLRYFYLSEYHSVLNSSTFLDVSLLSVDLKNRYIKDSSFMVYPVVNGSPYISFEFNRSAINYYSSRYINLFTSGLISSFSYNTIVLLFTPIMGSAQTGDAMIRFMNFSMLDATTITGWSSDGNEKGWAVFDVVNSQSCVWYDVFCHMTSSVGWVMNNIIGFKQLFKMVNLFFVPMSVTFKTYQKYNDWLGDLPFVSPVIVSGAMLLVLFNFYKSFK